MKYEFKDNTYITKANDNPKDLVEVEIGDAKQTEFFPQVKIKRWNNEVNFSARFVDNNPKVKANVSKVADTINWEKGSTKARFYQLDDAYEFDLVLNEAPTDNKVQFTINTKGLDFFFQPEITDEEAQKQLDAFIQNNDDDTTSPTLEEMKRQMRPENVVNSYAVYASEQKHNYAGGIEYKTGKVGHIYRPEIIDANGVKVWGVMDIDTKQGILTITIPQEFLDSAVFPIVVDPTFGYTSVGATRNTFISAGYFDSTYPTGSPSSDSTLVSMSLYLDVGTTNVEKIRMGLYNNLSIVADTGLSSLIQGTSAQWITVNATSQSVLSSVNYYLGFTHGGGAALAIYSDNLGFSSRYGKAAAPYGSALATQTGWYSWFVNTFSIYATYSSGSVAPTVTTQAVSDITTTTATGNGNVTADGGATITERGVCWKTSAGATTSDSKATASGTTGAYTVSMTSLTANTLYYVKAYAINSVGTSYGSEVTFTTSSVVSGNSNFLQFM